MDAFGRLVQQSGCVSDVDGNDIYRTTRQYREDIGLYYFYARWYDPELGMYIQKSPLPLPLERPYEYAQNDPANYIDVTGLVMRAMGPEFSGFPCRAEPPVDGATPAARLLGPVAPRPRGFLRQDDLPWFLPVAYPAGLFPVPEPRPLFPFTPLGQFAFGLTGGHTAVCGRMGFNVEIRLGFYRSGLVPIPRSFHVGVYAVPGLATPTQVLGGSATFNVALNGNPTAEWRGPFDNLTGGASGVVGGVFRGGGWYGADLGPGGNIGPAATVAGLSFQASRDYYDPFWECGWGN